MSDACTCTRCLAAAPVPVQTYLAPAAPSQTLTAPAAPPVPAAPLRLDLGCGPRKREGFTGIDCRPFPGVDVVFDLGGKEPWPFADGSVDEAHCSHVVEHFTAEQRIRFVNELCRVLKKGGKAQVIVPHWASCRAYGDLTHQWPPVSEFWFYYLQKEWRAANAPHNDAYTCDFDATWGYGVNPKIAAKHQDAQMFALEFYKEAAQDLVATLVKR